VNKLEMTKFEREHGFETPEKVFGEEERERLRKCLKGVNGGEKDADAVAEDVVEEGTPPVFTLEMCVSGGTYVRSLAHDIGHAVGSAAHVVTLTRTRQGRFRLDDAQKDAIEESSSSAGGSEGEASASAQVTQIESETGLPFRKCVPWEVFERALGGASGARRKSAHKPGVRAKEAASAATESTTDCASAAGGDGQEDAKAVVPDAIAETEAAKVDAEDEVDEDGWRPWERAVMEAMEIVEDKK
jgi:tRNA U55 pseudouridine synthase TruB